MDDPLWARFLTSDIWYALPLILAVSLVYAATRHEEMESILHHSWRIGKWIVGFMGAVFVVLTALTWYVG